MKYVIFGCGATGKRALKNMGEHKVACFVDNYHAGEEVYGKKVISFQELQDEYVRDERIVVVIASDFYWHEMEEQLQRAGIRQYYIFHGDEAQRRIYYLLNREMIFPSYEEMLQSYRMAQYKNIAIYGIGEDLRDFQLMLYELWYQAPDAKISVIPQKGYAGELDIPGCPVTSFSEAEKVIDCLFLNISRSQDEAEIREELAFQKKPYAVVDLYEVDRLDPSFHYEGLEAYKNIHHGKRVFLIGNGPSLTIDDLNTLHENKEICIAFNKIYRAYDRTPWRADYVCFTDANVIGDCIEDILHISGAVFMADSFHFSDNKCIPNVQYCHEFTEPFYFERPGFSKDISQGIYIGGSVIYDIGIQLAAYMGFTEMYLLGVDHSMSGSVAEPQSHFIPEYTLPNERAKYENLYFDTERVTRAFSKAECCSRKLGFRIFNATRGGKLEVFERVDFDSLFHQTGKD